MDLIDRGILDDLTRNCRVTYQELSEKYGVSSNAIRNRVLKLEETHVIYGYTVNLSLAMVNSSWVFGVLRTDGSQNEHDLVSRIGECRNIVAAAAYSDGNYTLVAETGTPTELLETGSFLRGLKGVQAVELYPVLWDAGKKMELTSAHLRILRCLVEDPRMSVVDVAERIGMTSRRVRRLVKELEESEAVRFTIQLELGAAKSIPFIARVTWDEHGTTAQRIPAWLRETYPMNFWQLFLAAAEPVFFALFAADSMTEVQDIALSLRQNNLLRDVKVMIGIHHRYFPGLRLRRLKEMLRDAAPA